MMKVCNKKISMLAASAAWILFAQSSQAAFMKGADSQDWLAFEREPIVSLYEAAAQAKHEFAEFNELSLTKSRDLRMMIDGVEIDSLQSLDQLESTQQVGADAWLQGLPRSKGSSAELALSPAKAECQYTRDSGLYECTTVAPTWASNFELQAFEPQVMILAPSDAAGKSELQRELESKRRLAQAELVRESLPSPAKDPATHLSAQATRHEGDVSEIKLFRGVPGIVVTEGGKISLTKLDSHVKLVMASEVKKGFVSMFIRDPAVAQLDAARNMLTAKQFGSTELFVVSRDRISIIPVKIEGPSPSHALAWSSSGAANSRAQVQEKGQERAQLTIAPDLSVPSSLASLDTLDRAASGVRSSFAASSLANASGRAPENLSVPGELSDWPSGGGDSISFSHGKAKTSFNKVIVRIVDERTSWDQSQVFPVGGLRLRILGTEFEARSDGQGYVEISDVPTGGRLLVEVTDTTGTTMPAFAELVVDGMSSVKTKAQMIFVRRFLSWDYSARMAGVVQNMEKSSFCGTAVDSSAKKSALAAVRVGTDAKAVGPFYFNDLGYLDTRLYATGKSGRFCFFNVEPGAVHLGIARPTATGEQSPTSAVVVMTAAGRHTEEFLALDDARHITTTVASVPTAGEQLSSDIDRANKYLPVDYAEVVPMGYAEPMVPIDDGVYTSATPLIPVRGRVWTVANSSDYEASVQASSIKLPGSRQITSLLPRGFVDDMMNYAQVQHDFDQGVIVVEHAAVAGQGTESVKIRLVDTSGRDAGEGWYFSDRPIAKAVFFNVPSGVYSVMIETSSGHWIAADTAVAYPETSTFVRTGAPLEKHMTQASAQN